MLSKMTSPYLALLATSVFLPRFASAITVKDLVVKFTDWLNLLIPLVIGIGLLYFIWGLATFINNSGDEKGRQEGKSKMLWGILALFVMVSVWGIVSLISTALVGGQGGTFDPPKF